MLLFYSKGELAKDLGFKYYSCLRKKKLEFGMLVMEVKGPKKILELLFHMLHLIPPNVFCFICGAISQWMWKIFVSTQHMEESKFLGVHERMVIKCFCLLSKQDWFWYGPFSIKLTRSALILLMFLVIQEQEKNRV